MKMAVVAILFASSVGAAAYLAYRLLGDSSPREKARVTLRGEVFLADLADSPRRRERGLSGRESLAQNEGMLFLFDTPSRQSFWMRGMITPIDIIWVLEGRVVGADERAEPRPDAPFWKLETYASPGPVTEALEVAAGTVARLGVTRGDAVEVRRGE